MKISSFFRKRIEWKETEKGGVNFVADCGGESLELRMNDFPAEKLYTFKYKNEELSFDDAPQNWVIPEP